MSNAVQELLNSFDRLPEAERREVFTEILKRNQEFESPDLNDEMLARLAEETFLSYDAEEAVDARSRSNRQVNSS
jgi:hypothetical protein